MPEAPETEPEPAYEQGQEPPENDTPLPPEPEIPDVDPLARIPAPTLPPDPRIKRPAPNRVQRPQ